ncbi:MAG: AAA family ATPase [Treponema sp.]|nr:AAA family ATPase [Treponema sp.]
MNDLSETKDIIRSGVSAVHICGDDYTQIDEFITGLAGELGFVEEDKPEPAVAEWNYGYGQVKFKTIQQIESAGGGKMSLPEFLDIYKNPLYAEKKIILIRNARHVLEGEANRENLAQLQQTILNLKKRLPGKAALIYCDERRFIPDELSSLVYFLELKPPSGEELADIAGTFAEQINLELDPEIRNKLSSMCVGMSKDSFDQILKKAALKRETFNSDVISIAREAKKQFVDKSGLLKYVDVNEKMDDVGGLGHLKWWLDQKKKAIFDPEAARERGIVPAKGILLVGMPGCGKTLSAKAIANKFGLPLLAMDLGSLMGKYLGESEENLRRALKLAENASPCVLWVDEIEKAFAGVGGDETGVSQRLFGYLLTWLNDKTARVFVVATANDIAVLPPEVLRRGRVDEIFSVDFPSAPERKEIFRIHLEKALKREPDFDLSEIARDKNPDGAPCTEGYAGSDIAALVNIAVETAWNQNKELSLEILQTQRKYLTPLKDVLEEKIKRNRKKFGQYKLISASESEANIQRFETDSDGDEEKQLDAARHEKCPDGILLKLAKKGSNKVKLAVLDHPRCGPDIIMLLREDPDEGVKAKAIEKFGGSEKGIIEIAKNGTKEQKMKLPELRNLPEEAQMLLANDSDKDVLKALLRYPYLSEPVWKQLVAKAQENAVLKQLILDDYPKSIRSQLRISCANCCYTNGVYYKPGTAVVDVFWCTRKGTKTFEACEFWSYSKK